MFTTWPFVAQLLQHDSNYLEWKTGGATAVGVRLQWPGRQLLQVYLGVLRTT